MKNIVILLTIVIIQSSCIGDAFVSTSYAIKNKSGNTIYVKGKLIAPNSDLRNQNRNYIIRHNSKRVVKIKSEVCGFGNCKNLISNHKNFNDIIIFRDSLYIDTINVQYKDWAIKKRHAFLLLKN